MKRYTFIVLICLSVFYIRYNSFVYYYNASGTSGITIVKYPFAKQVKVIPRIVSNPFMPLKNYYEIEYSRGAGGLGYHLLLDFSKPKTCIYVLSGKLIKKGLFDEPQIIYFERLVQETDKQATKDSIYQSLQNLFQKGDDLHKKAERHSVIYEGF